MRRLTAWAVAAVLVVTLPVAALAQQPAKPRSGDPGLPQTLLDQHAADPLCTPLPEVMHAEDVRVYPLTNDVALYMIPCMGGAYNFSHVLYLSNPYGETFQRLLFVDYTDRYGWMGTDQLYGIEFDPATLTLTSFYKGRGIADCGSSGVWVWDDYAFRLAAFYAKSDCDGTIDPGQFPQVWPG